MNMKLENVSVKVTVYMRVYNAELFGGIGSVGIASICFDTDAETVAADGAALLERGAANLVNLTARQLEVDKDDIEIISREEYDEESEDYDEETVIDLKKGGK